MEMGLSQFEPSPGKMFARLYLTNELGVVVHIYSAYAGSIGRRITIRGQSQTKAQALF
jgi:hypothetical protein